MIKRDFYYKSIENFIDRPFVKVITGIRRSGKSMMLKLIKNKILDSGVDSSQIIYINFESMQFYFIRTARELYEYIIKNIKSDKRIYLFFDEVQIVEKWEEAINSFMVDFDCDIYISGSNSNLLSSEISTLLTGRYVNFRIFPLSYLEMLDFRENINSNNLKDEDSIWKYIRLGGFPFIHNNEYDEETSFKIINDIYDSIVLRDVVNRYKIRDVDTLNRIIKYVVDNIGNTFSAKNISDYFKSQNRRIDISTVYNYILALESSFVINRVNRFDIKGKEILKTQEKFYLTDHGMQHAMFGYKDRNISGVLENIVYNELVRRGFNVYIGKLKNKEIDFIAQKRSDRLYIQVCYKIESENTFKREFDTLLEIDDHYPKYVLSMDNNITENIMGVKHMNIFTFISQDKLV